MNNEIRIIKRGIEQSKEVKPQNIKHKIITQDSPIIRQLREAEEKYRIRRELDDDELIELEFKEEADKIRAEAKKTAHIENVESSAESKISTNGQKVMPEELPIDDENLAYIRNLDEPVLYDLNNDSLQIRVKTNQNPTPKNNEILHREPLKKEGLNRFGNDIISSDKKYEETAVLKSTISSDLLNKQTSNLAANDNDSISLIERLQIDREKINESKNTVIRKVELHTMPSTPQDNAHLDIKRQDGIIDSIDDIDCKEGDIDKSNDTTYVVNSYANKSDSIIDAPSLVESSVDTNQDMYILPPTSLLNEPKYQKIDIDGSEIDIKAQNLISKLRVFRINGDITDIYSGPVVTTFEFRPAPDVKVSRIQNLENDLSMALKAKSIRIQAPIPGKDVVGIEIPNNTIQTIYIREIFESKEFVESNAQLAIALGKDIIGRPIVHNLAQLPHLLIAGTTGSGKSVGLNGMILSLLYKNTPEQLRFIMIDPKRVELSLYKDIPHLLTPIIADPKKAVIALSKATDEMNRRYELMNEVGVKNIIGYNEVAEQNGFDKLPYIVIIIDEFADLMIMGGKDSEQYLTSLASKARASGIHLIIATQRPTVNVVTGLIKSNLPSRVSYRVGSPMDSKVVLDKVGAETLLGNGDMLFSDKNMVSRYHAPYSSEKEIERVADFIRSQRSVEYDEFFSLEPKDITQGVSTSIVPTNEDEYMQKAKEIILSSGRTSASYLQRSLGVGFNRASNILESLEKEGFLSAPNSKNLREIIG